MDMIDRKFTVEVNVERNILLYCQSCSSETTHMVAATFVEKGSEYHGKGKSIGWQSDYQTVQCRTCKKVSFRIVYESSKEDANGNDEVSCSESLRYTPRSSGEIKSLDPEGLPKNFQDLYKDTVLAIECKQNVLARMGIRALLDAICDDNEISGDSLHQKANNLMGKHILSTEGFDILNNNHFLDSNNDKEAQQQKILLLAISAVEQIINCTYPTPDNISG